MVSTCMVCKARSSKEHNLSLHSFPKEKVIKARWLQALKLSAQAITASSKVCTKHFQSSAIRWDTAKLQLKKDAVPELLLLQTKQTVDPSTNNSARKYSVDPFQRVASTSTSTELFNFVGVTEDLFTNESIETSEQRNPFSEIETHLSDNVKVTLPGDEPLICSVISLENITSNSSLDESISFVRKPEDLSFYQDIPSSPLTIRLAEEQVTLPKNKSLKNCSGRRRFTQRYVGDMTVDDFDSPTRAAIHLKKVKEQYYKSKAEIRRLKLANKRLRNNVETLKDLTKHLKEKGVLADETADLLLSIFPKKFISED